jgi:6-phosphofructokinase 1
VLVASDVQSLQIVLEQGGSIPSFEPAGPRAELFFDPAELVCGLVTCGGLCPGVNNVIRSLVLTLHYGYGVRHIQGFRYGYAGLSSKSGYEPLALTPAVVENIHQQGGTLLGSSRGHQDAGEMVETLVRYGIGILFAIGGDGTLRGVHAIVNEITKRGLPISVIGVPKTIDNDLDWIERSFGFATAVDEARKVIVGAHAEARGAWDGIGLVKLMGRHSGFIAAHASLANSDVNFCLVPEIPLSLEGPKGFLNALERRLHEKHHAVIVAAEGAGQDLLQDLSQAERDASGNIRLKDIGPFLRDRIAAYFAGRGRDVTIKYIDPSYTIRSLPANSIDAEFCLMLGQHAAHAGLAGRTDMVVGYWNQRFTHVPIPLAVASRKTLDLNGETWQCVLEATGQPAVMR